MDLDSNALAAIRHNQTLLQDESEIAKFRLPLPGLPLAHGHGKGNADSGHGRFVPGGI